MKLYHCDGCGKMRKDVVAMGRDANGDFDSPDMCFLCRKELQRGKVWSNQDNKYIDYNLILWDYS